LRLYANAVGADINTVIKAHEESASRCPTAVV
jgi:hypothetical protein